VTRPITARLIEALVVKRFELADFGQAPVPPLIQREPSAMVIGLLPGQRLIVIVA